MKIQGNNITIKTDMPQNKAVYRPVFGAEKDEFVFSGEKNIEPENKGLFSKLAAVVSNVLSVFSEPEVKENRPVLNPPRKPSHVKRIDEINTGINALGKPDYSDTARFSEYLEKKINILLNESTEADIAAKIKTVSEQTGFDEKKTACIFARLSQFAGYSQIEALENEFKTHNISGIADYFLYMKPGNFRFKNDFSSSLTVNDALSYLSKNKKQIKFPKDGQKALFIDRAQLAELKDFKKQYPAKFSVLSDMVKEGEIKLALIDGWNASYCGKNLSQTIFGAPVDIDKAAKAIINEMQNDGVSLDYALNGDTVAELKNLFGKNTKVDIITNGSITDISAKSIAETKSSRHPSAKNIKNTIDVLAKTFTAGGYNESETRKFLAKYFNEMIMCFSPQNISDEMKEKYARICEAVKAKGQKPEDIIYIVPASGKSFDLVTYEFMNANNINPSQIIFYDGLNEIYKSVNGDYPDFKNKTAVIIDDFTGSGDSVMNTEFRYKAFKRGIGSECDVIISPMVSLKQGVNYVKKIMKKENKGKDLILPGKISDFDVFLQKNGIVNPDGRDYAMKLLGGFGYNSGGGCIAFPYMLPDNNSKISGVLLSYFLRDNNCDANKCHQLYDAIQTELYKN